MKKIFFLLLIIQTSVLFAQEKNDITLLETDDSWRKETLNFPFPFAQQIPLEGEIDVRFSKGWSDLDSPYFWSYAFAWNVTRGEKFTETEIEEYMQLYLGGLMKAVNRDKSFEVPETISVFSETSSNMETTNYKGKIRMHDSFFSKKIITLNVIGEIQYCKENNKSIFFFKLSPKDVNDEVWAYLHQAKLIESLCN